MKPLPMPAIELVHELLNYNPLTGAFVWKKSRGPRSAGSLAGSRHHDGYLYISVGGRILGAHRLAFLYVNGRSPADQVDHINGVRDDNRIVNLRECSNAENKQNMRRARADNRTGMLGVSPDGGRFRACIRYNGKTHNLGSYSTPELAHSAYLRAKAAVHPFATIRDLMRTTP